MDWRYPIGRPEMPEKLEPEHIQRWVEDMAAAPELLLTSVAGLSDPQLDTPYRPEGWTVRQVVHHLPDSHMSAYLNFRAGLTEEHAVSRSNDVDGWADLSDSKTGEISPSLELFSGLQHRWVNLIQTMAFDDFSRTIEVPGRGERSLWTILSIYAWHGKHHVAQITALRDRMGW